GIDGNIATLLGMASSGDRPVVGMIGDLTLLHDIGSLAISNETLNAVILVLDNQGGGIFDHLPQQRLDEHEALFITPQQVDLAALAQGFGVAYQSTTTAQLGRHLRQALSQSGVQLLHLRVERPESLAAHQRLWQRLHQ
ncbi:MAG: thiamine pyrophosphate-dependent enzyme, partial [Chromatiales bacterium]|nr:thiamine pyrophosphate-dependent enzyme [Chromatiales bacterium]